MRKMCDEFGVLLIFDEIQTGFGRLGRCSPPMLYHADPDIFTFGKAIAGGYPLAGVMMRDDLKSSPPPLPTRTPSRTSRSPSQPRARPSIRARGGEAPPAGRQMGNYITKRLKQLQKKYELIGDIRGPGLMIGIELVKNRKTKEHARGSPRVRPRGTEAGGHLRGNEVSSWATF